MSEKPGSPVAAAADNLLAKLASLPQASQEVVKSNAVGPIMQTVVEGSDAAKQDAVKGLAVIATNPIMDEAKQDSRLYPQLYGSPTAFLASGFFKASNRDPASPLKAGESPTSPATFSPRGLTLETQRMSPRRMETIVTKQRGFASLSRLATGVMTQQQETPAQAGRLGPLPHEITAAGVPALLEMAATANSQAQEQALAVLRDLAFTPNNRQLISASNGIHVLSDIMASQPPLACRIHAASCLRSLALDLNQAAQIGAAGVVPSLVDLLSDESAEAHESGVGALANLAACPRNRELIADAGGIEPLLKLLNETGTDDNIVDMAVGTLGNLAALKVNQVSIAAAGGVPALLRRLQAPQLGSQVVAAGALWSLAQNPENQARIAHWGGIPLLIKLASSETSELKLNVLGCLRYVAEIEENRRTIREAGGIKPLVQLFVGAWAGSPDLQEMACKCVLNLSITTGNHESIVECGALPAAVRFLLRGSPVAQEYSAGLLLNLASNSKMHGAINQSGVIAGLVKVLDSGCTQAQHNAVEAIRNLSVDPAACRQIQQANQASGIQLVVQQLCSDHLHAVWQAGCVLANLAACNLSTYHDAIAAAGALEPLIALLRCNSAEEQSAAMGAIRNLTSDIKWQRSLAQQGAIPHIIKGLRHPDFETRECAAAALGNLAAGNASIMDSEGQKVPIIRLMESSVPQLVHLCRSSHSGQAADCAASAAGALWRMIAAENIRGGATIKATLVASKAGVNFHQLLESESPRARENAAKALSFLEAAVLEEVGQPMTVDSIISTKEDAPKSTGTSASPPHMHLIVKAQ